MHNTDKFNEEFQKIDHFKKYPEMLPFVGRKYESKEHTKIIIIGESNFFPEASTIHLDVDNWYSGNSSTLSGEERKYISNIGIVNKGNNQYWKRGAHYMYKNIESCLIDSGFSKESNSMSHISYINGFFRPAKNGDSIKKICTADDIKASEVIINKIIDIIQPDLVLIASVYTNRKLSKLINHKNIQYTCHPLANFYWNRKGYKNGRNKFINIISNQLTIGKLYLINEH